MAQTNGTLEKIKIETYSDDKYKSKGSEEFVALFNPNKYSLKYEIEQNEKQGAGTSPSAPSFAKMKSQEIDLEFLLDGTGVTGETIDVQKKVDEFLKAAYEFKGDKHKPRYLRIWWGKAFVFDCVLKAADVNYTLFQPSGIPLRAKYHICFKGAKYTAAKFSNFVNDELRKRKTNKRSDITLYCTSQRKNRLI